MRLYLIYFAWYTKQECAFSWRITAVIRAYHGRDTCVSWARYVRIMGAIRAYHERDTPTAYVS